MAGRVRVYIAMSIDGFIAGPNDELDWLGDPSADATLPEGVLGFEAFLAQIGCMVMGRRTWDVVSGFDGWFYGELPILVPTSRPLQPGRATVRATSGPIDAVLDEALAIAAGKDVYVDGGHVVRAALDAGRVDELVITMAPVVLGAGLPLFAGVTRRHAMQLVSHRDYGRGMLQLVLRPSR
jgi:dihydrofolate reductase